MNDTIVPIEKIRAKARKAHAEGKGRDEHGFNWHAAALPVWQEEWDRCEAAIQGQAA
jgi:hypothetical protein